jgi:pimeloyl-ACP methyl ester carboxylesterase
MISFTDEGSGPAVALLHGWPVTALHWRHVAPALVSSGLRVLTLTLPGLGDGDVSAITTSDFAAPDDGNRWEKQALAAEVHALLADLGIHEVSIIGHDWGGTVGYLVTATSRGDVRTLVVEEEVPPGIGVPTRTSANSRYPDWHGPFLRAPGLAEALLPGREDAFHRAFLEASAGPAGLDPDVVDTYLRAYRGAPALIAGMGYYRSQEADARAIRSCSTRPLETPVLTIGGAHAMGTNVRQAFRLLAVRVEHVEVETAGHYPAEQDPDAVLGRLVPHLLRSS